MAFCPNCGKQFDGIGKFCSSCGYLIVSDTAPQAAPQAQPAYSAPAPQQIPTQQTYTAPAPQNNYTNPTPQYNAPYQPAQNFTPAANIQRTPVKNDYSLVMYLILTIFTLGIYALILTHNLAKDTNQMCAEDGQNTPGVLVVIILSLFTLGFYSYFWYYNVQTRLHNAAPRYRVNISEDGSSVLVWFIVGMFIPFISLIGMNIILTLPTLSALPTTQHTSTDKP